MLTIPANYHRIDGSDLKPTYGAKLLGSANPSEWLTVAVCVRHRTDGPPLPDHAHWMATPPGKRKFLSSEEFAAKHGAAQADIDAIVQFALSQGLTVGGTSVIGRTVLLSGTVEQVSRAFAVDLWSYQSPIGAYRGHDGDVYVPDVLAEIVPAVFGLDNRRAGYHSSMGDPSGATSTTPPAVAQLYNFPPVPPTINHQTIGVIEFNQETRGGWIQSDIDSTLFEFGLTTSTTPENVSVTGSNNPGSASQPNDPDGEVLLDICVAAAVAPGAKIKVYWGSDTTSAMDWLAVLTAVVAGPPDVLSCSWVLSGADDELSLAQVNQISAQFKALASMGVTVFAACGDDGARSKGRDGKAHLQYPGSDPWVTSCGGTTISTVPSFVEWVWNDFDPNPDETTRPQATGGGVSALFTGSLPPWQQAVSVPPSIRDGVTIGRGVPDVAGNASLNSGYQLTLYGEFNGLSGGTSAVAPLYAGLTARINASLPGNVGFLNPTLYAFKDTVCRDINDQLFPGSPPDNSVPAFSDPDSGLFFQAVTGYPSGPGWDACTGLGVIDGAALLSALQSVFHQDCQFIVDRTEIGKDEVKETLTGSQPGLIANAFYIVVDGFNAAALHIVASDLTGTPVQKPVFVASVPGLTVVATALLAEDVSLPVTPQRFTWVCAAQFDTSLSAFSTVPVPVTLTASIAGLTSPPATIELIGDADPYELDGPTWWLSTDLRVFQVTTGGSLQGLAAVILQNSGNAQVDAPSFIQSVIAGFNANTTQPPNHPFDLISIDEQAAQVTLNQFNPSTSTTPVYNFAMARVRYQATVPSSLVRVFFRIFQAATTSTAYGPQTYGSVSNSGVSASGKIAVFGVDGADNVVAIPCFASARVLDPTTLDQQNDDANVVLTGIPPSPSGGVAYLYFGCWLDINQPATTTAVPKSPLSADSANPWANGSESILAAITGKHQCLVAEISYDAGPVQAGETPASSDKLAQRNLAVVASGNPGGPSAHRVPHTFDIRPTPAALAARGRPDELMILWGSTPAGSVATIYLPAVNAAEVLELAARMYTTHQLEFVDDHTLQCSTGGVTWIPIPQASGANFAGLLTLDLPPTVRRGEAYTIVVRQVTDVTELLDKPDARPVSGEERRVLGSFQISIPVGVEEELLDSEESLLSIMRWVRQEKVPGDRWSPVLDRYVAQIAQRVEGFGGDPDKIPPSPTGSWYHPPDGFGSLVVTFTDKAGGSVNDFADVFLQQLNLPDHREIRRWRTGVPLSVRDLRRADTGIYEIQVLSDHYKAVARFVTIEDGQVTRVALVLEPK
jgi:Pro-kumamolisin, activation domain